jgi:hypothetical protein
MEEVSTIGLDLAKNVFQAHGARRDGSAAFRRRVSRSKMLAFFSSQPKRHPSWRRLPEIGAVFF